MPTPMQAPARGRRRAPWVIALVVAARSSDRADRWLGALVNLVPFFGVLALPVALIIVVLLASLPPYVQAKERASG
jgi:hypothetical protein